MYQQYREAWAALTAPGAEFEVVTTVVRGVPIKTYANALPTLRDVWLAFAAARAKYGLPIGDKAILSHFQLIAMLISCAA